MPDTSVSYLVMHVDQYRLALPVTEIAEVCRPADLQQVVPQQVEQQVDQQGTQQHSDQGSCLLGFAMLRGVPTPVLDPAVLLGLGQPAAQRTGLTGSNGRTGSNGNARLVRIRLAQQDSAPCVALLVDAVSGVYPIASADVRAVSLPGGQTQQLGEFDRQLARLLDASGLISAETWEQISAAVPSAPPAVQA